MTRTWQKQSFNNTCRLPLYPLSEWKRLNDDIPKRLFPLVSTGISLKCTPLSLLWADRAPPGSNCLAGQVHPKPRQHLGIHELCQHRVKSASNPFLSIIPMQQSLYIFSCSHDTIQNSFQWVSVSFLASLSSIYRQREIRGFILTRSVSPVKQL